MKKNDLLFKTDKIIDGNVEFNLPKESFELTNKDENISDIKFETKPVGYLKDSIRRFSKNKASLVAGVILVLLALFAIIEPLADPKSYVDPIRYPNGFQDKVFGDVLPRVDLFKGTGFWDGTEVRTITETDYELKRFTDSNYEQFEVIRSYEETYFIGPVEFSETYYDVRWDTYAVGTKELQLLPHQYTDLVEYEVEKGIFDTEDSILKPVTDLTAYLEKTKAQFLSEGMSESQAIFLNDKLKGFYLLNQSTYYEVMPVKISDGVYNDSQFEVVLDSEGEEIPIYKRDAEGNMVYVNQGTGSTYTVRVDYFDYFTYLNGFEPVFAFGTNLEGRDIMLRLANAIGFSLLLGVCISAINFMIGLVWGSISGYYGGRVDLLMERFTDIIVNVPTIIIMTIVQIQLINNTEVQAVLGASGALIVAVFIAFIYNGWVGVSSTTRMQFYRYKGQEYVLASRTLGAKDRRLIFKHILPNAAGTLVTGSVLMIPGVIFGESSLAYLGIIDFQASGISSIGVLLSEGQKAGISTSPHIILFPAIVISILMICFNLFGNGLRDAFNTTLRGSED